jgi:ureidoacrylate peracid hydrolase
MNAITGKGRLLEDAERMAPAHTALVLIDIQNDFCHPDGVFGKLDHDLSMMPGMAQNTHTILAAARRKGILTVFVRATYDDEVLSGPLAETYHRRQFIDSQCLEGSFGAGWYAGLAPAPGATNEIAVTKHRFSAFFGSEIDLVLRANGIRTLVLCGVVTSGCVESTLRDAFFRDYYVVCASDCVTEASPERHRASLHKIEQAFGAVRTASSVAALWDSLPGHVAPPSFEAKRAAALTDLRARLQPARCAFVLIDLQHDACSPDGARARGGETLGAVGAAVKVAATLLAHARAVGMQVIHVRTEHGDAQASPAGLLASSAPQGWRTGTTGAEFVPETAPLAGEWIVTKHRSSGFVDTRLELLLRSNGIVSLLLCGVATHGAVESTVRDAAMRDYYVVVARDAVASPDSRMHLHAAALETMALEFADCRTTEDIAAAMHAAAPATD